MNIFYFCYSHNHPNGGQKHTYRHVDILRCYGYDAFIVHPGKGFRISWFSNQTPVLDFEDFLRIVDPRIDFVVLPEDLGMEILEFPGRKVIFNKNCSHGFRCFQSLPIELYPYQHPDVVAAFAVSNHSKECLEFTYPHLLVERMYAEIDPSVFSPCPLEDKTPQIAFVEKAMDSLLPIKHMIESRSVAGLNRGERFTWKLLARCTESETARILQESLVVLFVSGAEGLPRLPLEAMASGCIVFGYRHGPMSEILPPGQGFEHSDFIGLARSIEDVMEAYPRSLYEFQATVNAGLAIAGAFTLKRQEVRLLDAWSHIFANCDV